MRKKLTKIGKLIGTTLVIIGISGSLMVIFGGCSATQPTACRHEAYLAAIMTGGQVAVGYASQADKARNITHAQAISADGEWLDLSCGEVRHNAKPQLVEVIGYYSVDDIFLLMRNGTWR